MRADRLLSLLMLLQTRGRQTARDLAERLEVSERTIYRDLDALGATGVPIVVERGRRGGCSLMDGYYTDLTGLNDAEVRTLFVVRALGHLADLGLDAASETALLKLLAALPSGYRSVAERALERIHLDTEIWFQAADPVPYLSPVHDAVWQERRLRLTYRHGDGTITAGVVEPLGLVAKARVWYLVARTMEQVPRVFRVSRMQEAVLLDEQFVRPSAFNLRTHWATWCAAFEHSIPRYPVTIRVAPEAMARLQTLLGEEVDIHLAQAMPADVAGWCTVPVAFERFDDARRALLGCGPLVEVIEPRDLRESILRDAASLIAGYLREGGGGRS